MTGTIGERFGSGRLPAKELLRHKWAALLQLQGAVDLASQG